MKQSDSKKVIPQIKNRQEQLNPNNEKFWKVRNVSNVGNNLKTH